MKSLTFKTPSEQEFKELCTLIKDYELDNRNLIKEQFTIVLKDGKLAAFGRLLEHKDCTELCSVGVVKSLRNSGIGSLLIKKIMSKTNESIYLVCIIPNYFERFGFKIINEYPASIRNKMNYCTDQLVVPETYIAMISQKE